MDTNEKALIPGVPPLTGNHIHPGYLGKLPNLTGTIVLREYTSPRPLTLPPAACPKFRSHPPRRQSKRENAIIDRNISSPLSLYRPHDFNLAPASVRNAELKIISRVSHPFADDSPRRGNEITDVRLGLTEGASKLPQLIALSLF